MGLWRKNGNPVLRQRRLHDPLMNHQLTYILISAIWQNLERVIAEIWKSTSSFSYGSHCEKAPADLEQTEIYIFQPQQHIKHPIMAEIAATNYRSHGSSWKKVQCTSVAQRLLLLTRISTCSDPGKYRSRYFPPYKNDPCVKRGVFLIQKQPTVVTPAGCSIFWLF